MVVYGCTPAGDDPKTTLLLDFDSGKLDRTLVAQYGEPGEGVNMKPSGSSLRIVIPPGRAGRPPAEVKGRFKIEGDFELKMDYQIQSLPKPQKEWINVAILVEGAGGKAAVYRTNHFKSGQGNAAWAESGEGKEKRVFAVQKPTEDSRGTLRLTRTGSQLIFETAGPSGKFQKIATREFGKAPVDTVAFHILLSPAVTEPIDVTFANISVTAERIIATGAGN